MIEFTMARFSACLCGVLLIAILFNPVVDSYDSRTEDGLEENCMSIGRMFDSFMESGTDECTLALGILLPDSESYLSFDGSTMTLRSPQGTWTYELRNAVVADSEDYGTNDLLLLTKEEGMMHILRL